MFAATRPIAQLPDAARELERLGFDELWIPEDCFAHGGIAAAATALASTDHLSVGIGLLPATVRNVGIVAMELDSLALLHPGRVQAAFGHGVEAWMRQIGARPRDRIRALREVVSATRALLNGETVSVAGAHLTLDRVRLDVPPGRPPRILIGTTGAKGIALASQLGVGVLLPEGATAAAVEWATTACGPVAEATVYAWARVADRRDQALEQLRPIVRAWRDGAMYPNLIARSRLRAAGPVPDQELAGIAIAGTPADCAESITALYTAGASSIVVLPVGPDPHDQLARMAGEVVPLLEADGARSRP
jgi:alkanesulfonate monooxygenase SsuD/methylene tetrahydromethanopterin reductase-like flavin-dependent oxidoreductase (luciferase family)